MSVANHTLRLLLVVMLPALHAAYADPELTNYRSGIDVVWSGQKGTDYYEEYLYHDKLVDDRKIVYLRSSTQITMSHNSTNVAYYHVNDGGRIEIGVNGRDTIPNSGDEGVIRYKINRDRQYKYKWAQNSAKTDSNLRLPAYTAPFSFSSLRYEDGTAVVGATGFNSTMTSSKVDSFHRAILDSFGDEWHTLAYADDDEGFLSKTLAATGNFVDQAFYASDGKTILIVVDPKTPCITLRATGTGQFYTTPPKSYWTPRIHQQTSYISPGSSGNVTVELRDLYGNAVFYRINGGVYQTNGTSSVTLNASSFPNGQSTLDYYYAGREQNVKRRVIVKDPPFPSAGEPHGFRLLGDEAGLTRAKARITQAPYLSTYQGYRNRGDFSGQDAWDLFARRGLRYSTSMMLENSFVARIEGFNFKRSGTTKSHGQYAKEMLLEGFKNLDPIGFEMQHSSDAIPNRESHYRGYFDSLPVLKAAFAYDLMIGSFRSDQVAGGITPIEDLLIRDRLASFAFEAMLWSGDMTALGAPGMWGGVRMMCAQSIGIIMPNYSTPYFGTSGFGSNTTTYLDCPFPSDALTWKQALFDGSAPRKGYPNFTWSTGVSNNGSGNNMFLSNSETVGGRQYPTGTWADRASYFSPGLAGIHIAVWANMVRQWLGHSEGMLDSAVLSSANATFIGAKDPYPQTPSRIINLLYVNNRWPEAARSAGSYLSTLPSTDMAGPEKLMQDAGVFGFAWFDHTYVSSPTSPTATPPSNARIESFITK